MPARLLLHDESLDLVIDLLGVCAGAVADTIELAPLRAGKRAREELGDAPGAGARPSPTQGAIPVRRSRRIRRSGVGSESWASSCAHSAGMRWAIVARSRTERPCHTPAPEQWST